MIKKVVFAQILALIVITGVMFLLWSAQASLSFLLAGSSLVIPNIFLAINMSVAKFSQFFLWFGLVVNKFIVVLLLLISVKLLVDPVWIAFVLGIVIMGHVPAVYGLYTSIRNMN